MRVSTLLNAVFVIEVVMKNIAFTPRGYWQSRRNRYDLLVSVAGVVWVLLQTFLRSELTYFFGFMVVIFRELKAYGTSWEFWRKELCADDDHTESLSFYFLAGIFCAACKTILFHRSSFDTIYSKK